MSGSEVLFEVQGKIGLITLNRPDSLNAMNPEMSYALLRYFQEVEENESIRAVVLTGAGRGFCAGEDLKGVSDDLSPRKVLHERYIPLITRMRSLSKPIICAVNGPAAGAGFSLALACDIRIASEKATFGQVFVNIGFVPDAGSTYFLPRLIGNGLALEMMLSGNVIDARRAKEIGLVNRVVRQEDLMAESLGLANKLAEKAPLAIKHTKLLVYGSESRTLDEQMANEAEIQEQLAHTLDFKEGTAAFLQKRKPNFVGK